MSISLEGYIEQANNDIYLFECYWLKCQRENPEDFDSSDMTGADWDDQFIAWIDLGKPKFLS